MQFDTVRRVVKRLSFDTVGRDEPFSGEAWWLQRFGRWQRECVIFCHLCFEFASVLLLAKAFSFATTITTRPTHLSLFRTRRVPIHRDLTHTFAKRRDQCVARYLCMHAHVRTHTTYQYIPI